MQSNLTEHKVHTVLAEHLAQLIYTLPSVSAVCEAHNTYTSISIFRVQDQVYAYPDDDLNAMTPQYRFMFTASVTYSAIHIGSHPPIPLCNPDAIAQAFELFRRIING